MHKRGGVGLRVGMARAGRGSFAIAVLRPGTALQADGALTTGCSDASSGCGRYM